MKKVLPAVALIAVFGTAWLLWPKGVSDESLEVEAPVEDEPSAEEIDSILGLESPEAQERPSAERRPPRFDQMSEEEREAWRERRRERRERMRERWQNATPEERKRWAERRVSIQPLGDTAPEIEAVEVLDAMRELRPQMRDCIRDNGGFGALRDAMRSADAGPRGGMTVSFELSAEGTVNEGSFAMSPAPPAVYQQCFEKALGNLNAPVPGGDGAAIEMRMGRGGGRGRDRGNAEQDNREPQAPRAEDVRPRRAR